MKWTILDVAWSPITIIDIDRESGSKEGRKKDRTYKKRGRGWKIDIKIKR